MIAIRNLSRVRFFVRKSVVVFVFHLELAGAHPCRRRIFCIHFPPRERRREGAGRGGGKEGQENAQSVSSLSCVPISQPLSFARSQEARSAIKHVTLV